LTDAYDAAVVLGGPPLNKADLVGQAKTLAVHHTFARSTFDPAATLRGFCGLGHGIIHPAVRQLGGVRLSLFRSNGEGIPRRRARIVIHGYLTGLSRPDQVVHFFRQSSSGRESHPSALTEPDVTLSRHPTLTPQPPAARLVPTRQTVWGPAARCVPANASTHVLGV
jgi:hypothetical protein